MTFLEAKFTYVQMHNDLYVETEISLEVVVCLICSFVCNKKFYCICMRMKIYDILNKGLMFFQIGLNENYLGVSKLYF